MNPIVIIPAYNPPPTFQCMINEINDTMSIPIIVVDDGTKPIIHLQANNLTLLRNDCNKGKGYSLLKAFDHAYERGFTHAITLDADGQHDPKLLGEFLKIDENISIVLGSRNFNTDMPFLRRISNQITTMIISYISRVTILDTQCGYRRYKLSHICSEHFIEDGFQFETEVLIKLLGKKNHKFHHLKIPTIYGHNNSSINHITDTIKFIRLIYRTLSNI